MRTDAFSTDELSRKIRRITAEVRVVIRRETGEDYDESLIEDSMKTCVLNSLERLEEGLREMFTSPEKPEFQELTGILTRNEVTKPVLAAAAHDMAHSATTKGVFAGNRSFSKGKMAAMIEYLTSKGHHFYKTGLNKLLFYSDLTYFYLRNQGMSGDVYYNRPFGPVSDSAMPVLAELIETESVKVVPRTQTLQACKSEHVNMLTHEELRVLDWVADTYGSMTASGISDLSHSEKAYKFTDPNQPIAYAYAKFLKHLPPRDLLDN